MLVRCFEICVEKGSEFPEGHKLRKFEGRTVFQGNNVMDESSDTPFFSELGSSPATMEAGKAVDAYGSQPGHTAEQNDGVQAYTQASMEGIETWVEIPRDRWPKHWIGKFIRPVVLLRIALYGHPDSGGLWERHCEAMLTEVGFTMPDPEGWPSVFFHPELKLLLVVYVDDFKMAGPIESMSKGWQLIASKIDMARIHPGKSIDILVAIMFTRRMFFFQLMIIHLPTYLASPCLTRPRKPPPQRTGHRISGKSSQDWESM